MNRMNDLINRQDAINALGEEPDVYSGKDEYAQGLNNQWHYDVNAIKAVPSVQSELSMEIQEILNYLDTTLHPIVSPEHWDVYSKLHDMISALPSVQPEQRWIPVTEKLPKKSGYYLATIDIGLKTVDVIYFNNASGFLMANTVTAWKPRPEPYREDEQDG